MFQQIKQLIQSTVLAVDEIQELRSLLKVNETEPVDQVKWVPIDMVKSNDYNPNAVPTIEMKLLYLSILHDGYTQPIVTVWSEAEQSHLNWIALNATTCAWDVMCCTLVVCVPIATCDVAHAAEVVEEAFDGGEMWQAVTALHSSRSRRHTPV